jgi:hypothetical protein
MDVANPLLSAAPAKTKAARLGRQCGARGDYGLCASNDKGQGGKPRFQNVRIPSSISFNNSVILRSTPS